MGPPWGHTRHKLAQLSGSLCGPIPETRRRPTPPGPSGFPPYAGPSSADGAAGTSPSGDAPTSGTRPRQNNYGVWDDAPSVCAFRISIGTAMGL